MLCQRILIVAAHGPMRAIAQGDDGDLVLLWDSTLLYLTRASLLCLDDVLTRAAQQPNESVSTAQFQWHPAPEDDALVWMGRTCFYLPSEDKPIFCSLVREAAEQLRSMALLGLRNQSPFSPAFCQLTVAQADEVALN